MEPDSPETTSMRTTWPQVNVGGKSEIEWDVVVIGAGPAGATVARLLAKAGRSVMLIDSKAFPREKVCGGCVSARAAWVLERTGLATLAADTGAAPLQSFRVSIPNNSIEFALPGGFSLSRRALDNYLVQAAINEGVHFCPQTTASVDAESFPDHRDVTVRHAGIVQRVSARCVVCADGLLRGSVRQIPELAAYVSEHSNMGIGACVRDVHPQVADAVRQGTIQMIVGRGGYVGLARCEDGQLSIAAAISPDSLKAEKTPDRVIHRLLSSVGFPERHLASADWQGTPLLTSQARLVATNRVFVIGDAAGYVEPFTGEGMATALESACLVSPLVDQAIEHWSPQQARSWQCCYQRMIRRSQGTVRGLAKLLRHPLWAPPAMMFCQMFPAFPQWLLNRAYNPRSLPGFSFDGLSDLTNVFSNDNRKKAIACR